MLLWLLGSFVMCEAVVGFTLTVLLLLGRTDMALVVDTLSFTGFVIFAFGLIPLLSRFRKFALYAPEEESQQDEDQAERKSGSRLREFADRNRLSFRAILIGGLLMGTAFGLFAVQGIR